MKKMNKKGFTLIELLAIIVILAIIAVITVPLILGIIDEAKAKAFKSSVVGYGKAVELAYGKVGISDAAGLVKDMPTAESENKVTTTELGNGSYVAITVGTDDIKAYKVDYSGDQIVCDYDSTGDTTGTNNTVNGGKLLLKNCKVNGGSTAYVYDNGRGCTDDEYTNNHNACPANN